VTDNGHAESEWAFLPEAARRLNLSPQTVRRKLKRGELESRQVQTKTGLAYQVRLVAESPLPGQTSQGQPSPGLVEMVSLVKDLHAELIARTEAAASWQARAEFLAGELQQACEQLALMAPKEETVAAEPITKPDAASGPAPRPWWRFWR
jgi:hypothetical protein